MNVRGPSIFTVFIKNLSLADRIGIILFLLSFLAAPFSLLLAALPLLLFILLCFTAPFLPAIGFFLPVVSRGLTEKRGVAVTFDDGPDPVSTPALLDLLSKHRVSATFYVTGLRAEQYPHLIHKIVSKGHTIGNHSYSHDNLIMFRSAGALKKEIEKAQLVLHRLGVFPRTFRPPVGITNPKLGKVLKQMDLFTVNFSRRAGDRGNRRIAHLSRIILKRVRSGDIIMLHDITPRNDQMARHWMKEVDRILCGIQEKNLRILPLEELIDRQVMALEDPQS